ncbi:VPS10 domain-containing receptor SorCS2 [Fukomys damarensis]|uniref:VPS10 domain-containing receptor SorCS2 n=1 Tax=Fukomys damarensis TaxID=885580 RepID=A0A091D3Z8_FUKDA|nr:VPS10 domain-containing receptor SorCS2 [Fukomys damarensis]
MGSGGTGCEGRAQHLAGDQSLPPGLHRKSAPASSAQGTALATRDEPDPGATTDSELGPCHKNQDWDVRSSDFGTSYTKLTLQPGVTTIIDNFYICPTNKRKNENPKSCPLMPRSLGEEHGMHRRDMTWAFTPDRKPRGTLASPPVLLLCDLQASGLALRSEIGSALQLIRAMGIWDEVRDVDKAQARAGPTAGALNASPNFGGHSTQSCAGDHEETPEHFFGIVSSMDRVIRPLGVVGSCPAQILACGWQAVTIILVSSSLSDRGQSLFLSTDEGASFQRQPILFLVETLLFHPKDEDKVLAYTEESELYVSSDLGKKWTLLQEHVTKDHMFWAVSGVDAEPDLVHMETQDLNGGVRYVTCRIHSCSDEMLVAPFPGPIDHGSLAVQDDYILLKTTSTNQTKYYVSYRRNDFVLMKLPKYALPKACTSVSRKDLQVISTDESQVFVAVQEWYQTDTYNLYQSDPRGVHYALVLEDVRSSRQAEESVVIDILEVRGVKGVFLANRKVDGKVMTLITYNKGHNWDFLRPPSSDMNGKPTNCQPPDCHLHLHLRWADNPYVSGTVHTKDTAPGLIMGAGNLGSQLVEYKEEMYITADCGRTWRQVFEEEHHILYLDHGGVIVAIKDTSIPLKILKFSVDEGVTWSTHNFTGTSVFVDGLLSEPGDETLVMTVFGHISFRSDWELVKVDFRPSFSRPCGEDDYGSWDLASLQGDRCIMGQQRSYRKRKPASWCVQGRSFTSALSVRVCQCRDSDFLCDYGFEHTPSSEPGTKCAANFWFNPLAPPDDCAVGQTYTSSAGYRKVVSNVCEGGCDAGRAPLGTLTWQAECWAGWGSLAACPRTASLTKVRQKQGDVLTTKYQVDLGDGFKAMYVNLTLTGEPIRHRYESPGIYRVSVRAENMAGHDEAVLFVQVNSPLQALYLEVSPVIGVNQDVNLTAVLLPLNANLTVFYWWIGHSLQPLLSLDNSVTTRFAAPGDVRVTVQAACGSSVLQDSRVVRVLDQFQVVPLCFSRELDAFNPNTPEWREDVGLVVSRLLSKETSVPEELLVTVVKPGLPTMADLYVLLPPPRPTRKRSLSSDKRLTAVRQVLSAQKISFLVRGGLRILVALRDTDTAAGHGRQRSSSAASGGGLSRVPCARRKRPGRTVYAQMHNEKEQEMTSPVSHGEDVPGAAVQGNHSGVVLSINSREMHSYLVS